MDDRFFKQPVLNSPYEYPARHWELDETGQPTQQIIERRRSAEFIMPIPKPRKRRRGLAQQLQMVLDEGKGLATEDQQYDLTSTSNTIRR
jgi:type III restriction enzyme